MLNQRQDGECMILSGFARLMNDPRYSSAAGEVDAAIKQGCRNWIFEMADVRDPGAPLLGLLITLTRLIRQAGGEVALARVSRPLQAALQDMQMEDHWDRYDSVEEAQRGLTGEPG